MSDGVTQPPSMHVHRFGSDAPDAPVVLALHGLTGHGRRWESLAAEGFPHATVIAPDLLGHGRSSWEPPWALSDHVAAVSSVLDAHAPGRPVTVLAHSFGSAIAIGLAQARSEVTGLVLLDPAQGLDPAQAREYAERTLSQWGYPDAEAAAAAKRMEGWSQVPAEVLDAEIAEHLVPADADSGVVWRVSAPATAVAWSEMARDFRLPPVGVPTHVVVADRVQPPFVRPEFLAACSARRPDSVTVHHVDTEHMIPFLVPDVVAALVRDLIDRS